MYELINKWFTRPNTCTGLFTWLCHMCIIFKHHWDTPIQTLSCLDLGTRNQCFVMALSGTSPFRMYTFWREGFMNKVLMYLRCKAVSTIFRRGRGQGLSGGSPRRAEYASCLKPNVFLIHEDFVPNMKQMSLMFRLNFGTCLFAFT